MKTKNHLLIIGTSLASILSGTSQTTPLHILQQPSNQVVYAGEDVSFSASVDGSPPPSFQWRFNGNNLPNQTDSVLNLSQVNFTNAGAYTVMASNAAGSVTSQTAWLSVLPPDVVNLGGWEARFTSPSNNVVWDSTRKDDINPSITSDGLTLFFSSKAPGGSGGYDLWMVTRPTVSSRWGAPVNLGPDINSEADDADARLSPDGLSLYFDSTRPGGSGGWDIWVATRPNPSAPFGKPVNLGPDVNSIKDDGNISISADNRIMVFYSDGPGSLGSPDVWIATRTDPEGPWSPAQNPGGPINSRSIDFPAALSPDGLVLYFFSNRHRVPGSLWMSRRDSTDAPFGPPSLIQPLLEPVNGVDYASLSADGSTLYYQIYTGDTWFEWSGMRQINLTKLPQFKPLPTTPQGEFQFQLLGREGANYELSFSTDLRTWTPWLTTNTSNHVNLVDPGSRGVNQRVYRGVSH
jgi:hypothetical protein